MRIVSFPAKSDKRSEPEKYYCTIFYPFSLVRLLATMRVVTLCTISIVLLTLFGDVTGGKFKNAIDVFRNMVKSNKKSTNEGPKVKGVDSPNMKANAPTFKDRVFKSVINWFMLYTNFYN